MLRRKGPTSSPTRSGVDVSLPTSNGGGRSVQVDYEVDDMKGHPSTTSPRIPMQTLISHGIVAIVVFMFSSSSPCMDRGVFRTTASSAYLPKYNNNNHNCPTTILEYLDWFGDQLPNERKKTPLKRVQPADTRIPPEKMTPVPSKYRKTFYYDGEEISQPVARAFRSRGWQRVDSTINAHMIYTYSNNPDWATTLKPWQRFNFIPGYRKWNKKDTFAYYYKQWEAKHNDRPPSVYVPETYLLTDSTEEILAFAKVLKTGGSKYPWVHKQANVNQGRGITILAPESDQLLALPEKYLREKQLKEKYLKEPHAESTGDDDDDDVDYEDDVIIQRYICNEMTWNRRKFDVRMFWLVASLDPLIILYHDGYVRIGNSEYSEEDFSDTTAHLTTHTGLGTEGKATMMEFEQALDDLYSRMGNNNNNQRPHLAAGTPIAHVRNQFKHALGEMTEVFLKESFNKPDFKEITSENGFNFYCADYILDNDLDVFFIEPQNGCGLDEDYYFRLEMHGSLFNGMVDILEEVGRKQEAGLPVMPLEKSGNWEVIYADGLVYQYDGYKRSKNKASCSTTK
ncbi:tubulin-tyrosine ligase family protein [Nitzschia inconspicua]|uniref:Tubulin-tyrosine ligase family protein n=1 Tax=Nitzschia inconspicua TaxID=303405 RepID=A0A9K3PDE1_9STRA|nr:tubulin-tyrosine ligase family protein [Nitzschia inconspicua]